MFAAYILEKGRWKAPRRPGPRGSAGNGPQCFDGRDVGGQADRRLWCLAGFGVNKTLVLGFAGTTATDLRDVAATCFHLLDRAAAGPRGQTYHFGAGFWEFNETMTGGLREPGCSDGGVDRQADRSLAIARRRARERRRSRFDQPVRGGGDAAHGGAPHTFKDVSADKIQSTMVAAVTNNDFETWPAATGMMVNRWVNYRPHPNDAAQHLSAQARGRGLYVHKPSRCYFVSCPMEIEHQDFALASAKVVVGPQPRAAQVPAPRGGVEGLAGEALQEVHAAPAEPASTAGQAGQAGRRPAGQTGNLNPTAARPTLGTAALNPTAAHSTLNSATLKARGEQARDTTHQARHAAHQVRHADYKARRRLQARRRHQSATRLQARHADYKARHATLSATPTTKPATPTTKPATPPTKSATPPARRSRGAGGG